MLSCQNPQMYFSLTVSPNNWNLSLYLIYKKKKKKLQMEKFVSVNILLGSSDLLIVCLLLYRWQLLKETKKKINE